MQKQRIVIWGSGRFGELAYYYYKNECDILFFTDSNSSRWDKELCNILIMSPDNLRKINDVRVVLAFESGKDKVKKTLNETYGIFDIVEFQVHEDNTVNSLENENIDENSIIMKFTGGLGNQLFQFALLYYFCHIGIKTIIDTSYYNNSGVMKFSLLDAFEIPPMVVTDASEAINSVIVKLISSNESLNYTIYREKTIYENSVKSADKALLNIKAGYLKGTFQSYYFVEQCKEALLKDLKYRPLPKELSDRIKYYKNNYNLISMHIRRGDYLTERNKRIYGNICTEKYYNNAIEFIEKHVDNALFLIFSDDIQYAKDTYVGDKFIYMDKENTEAYKDWYDMCLMSQCKHNIIANSTFSWWGAMLNRGDDKIVIAPDRWVNDCKYLDIYPEEWVIIEG